MRILHIRITRWRHFSNIGFKIPENAPVVCIVGGNGAGKSQILELIAGCAEQIGISPGTEIPRGNPFHEEADFEVKFSVPQGVISQLEDLANFPPGSLEEQRPKWDRTITIVRSGTQTTMTSGGVDLPHSQNFAQHIRHLILASSSVHYLALDADRSYPAIQIGQHQMGEIYDRNWEDERKQSSFRITRSLYEDWFKYFIGVEAREGLKLMQDIRRARDAGVPEPAFVDKFAPYKTALTKVLPHLSFVGVNSAARTIKFDTNGIELNFSQLSGGEREIAFLIGQIERFGLKRGLLLVDEPELHLNYDLLRAWIGFLRDSVEAGQIWMATHALEVVEVAGQDASILLSRDDATRKVTSAISLGDQPIIATLSRAVGSPAFSIASLSFILVEGETEIGERERYRMLCGFPANTRFMESGSCGEVLRRLSGLRQVSEAAGQELKLGAVVDNDFRTKAEIDSLAAQRVFVIGLHEVENFFLHPPTLKRYYANVGGDASVVDGYVLELADARAGTWIFDATRTAKEFRDFPEPSKAVRELVHRLTWAEFSEDENIFDQVANTHGDLSDEQVRKMANHLRVRAAIYAKRRGVDEIWKICEGKELFKSLLPKLGISDGSIVERGISAIWDVDPSSRPEELNALRDYVSSV